MGRYLNEFEVEKIFCMSGLPVSLFSIVQGFFMCKHALVFGINAFFYSIISVLMISLKRRSNQLREYKFLNWDQLSSNKQLGSAKQKQSWRVAKNKFLDYLKMKFVK